jgi:3-hydroxyanthranilate 3,4-dioxygenase
VAEPRIPIDLLGWIADNADAFAPPVANKVLWSDSDFIFMIVRGPNARSDFHIDPGDEIFYQLRGTIRLDLIDDAGQRIEHRLDAGEVMLVPAGTPHAPLRPADSWGLVIERRRAPDELDAVRWYCDACGSVVHEAHFHVDDIEVELKAALEAFNASVAHRTCPTCGTIAPVPGFFELD